MAEADGEDTVTESMDKSTDPKHLPRMTVHHVAIICSDYARTRAFYHDILGFEIVGETYREERQSHKLDLHVGGGLYLEVFTFPDSPPRPSYPEACGLRHLAFRVESIEPIVAKLGAHGIQYEAVRVATNGRDRFTFFADPDGLPLELYEVAPEAKPETKEQETAEHLHTILGTKGEL